MYNYIVFGPPCSGKTTFVNGQEIFATDGDYGEEGFKKPEVLNQNSVI